MVAGWLPSLLLESLPDEHGGGEILRSSGPELGLEELLHREEQDGLSGYLYGHRIGGEVLEVVGTDDPSQHVEQAVTGREQLMSLGEQVRSPRPEPSRVEPGTCFKLIERGQKSLHVLRSTPVDDVEVGRRHGHAMEYR